MAQHFGSIVTSEVISTYCSHFINASPHEILPHFIKEKNVAIIELELFSCLLDVPLKKLKYNALKVLNSVCLLKKKREKRITAISSDLTRELSILKRAEFSLQRIFFYTVQFYTHHL